MEFCDQLPVINNVSFKRKVLVNNAINVQLHGFCNASESSYGACIYLRSMDSTGNVSSSLFYAKLITLITAITEISFEKVVLWSDSLLHCIEFRLPHIC